MFIGSSYFKRAWQAVPPPRPVTLLMGAVYTVLMLQGIGGFIWPGDGAEFLDPAVRVWACATLAFAGLLGTVSIPGGVWMLEKASIFFVCGVYLVHLYWQVSDMDKDGTIEPGKIARMAIIILLMVSRYLLIRGRDLDPAHTGTFRRVRDRGISG